MLRTRQEELLETRLEGLRRSLATTDRVLSGRNVILTFSREGSKNSSPAHSAGDRITIEIGRIPNLGSSSALVEILGLNYHELGHVLYGVQHRMLTQSVLSSQRHARFMEAYRALEEARVETLLAAKYAKMKKYFAYPVIKYFVKDKTAWPTAFLFTYGRRYLPLKIRETFKNIFSSTYGGSGEFADIIDKYRVIAFTNNARIRDGALLINQFAGLLERYNVPALSTHDSTGDDGGDDEDNRNTTKPHSDDETADDAAVAQQQAQQQDEKEKKGEDGSGFRDQDDEEEDEDGEPEDGGGENGSNDDESDQGGDEPESEGSGDGQGDEGDEGDPSDDGDGDQDGDGQQSPERSGGSGNDSSDQEDSLDQSGPPSSGQSRSSASHPSVRSRRQPTRQELEQQQEELASEMSEVLDIVLDDQDIQDDVENLKAAMDDDSGLSSSLRRRGRTLTEDLQPITPQMLVEADKLKDALRQLWAQMEPGWMYGLAEGNRIDMQRAAQAQTADDYDSIYVDWREGQQENSGLEVVIVPDESWSMCEPIPDNRFTEKSTVVSRQIWELMYALQEVEARVTVISFSDDAFTMYDREDRVTTKGYIRLVPDSGTNPTYALVEAKRIFTASEMPHKLLITISDGAWDHWANQNCPDILRGMEGVVKVAAVIDTQGNNYEFKMAPEYDVVRRTSGSIFDVMADAVTKMVEGNLNS